MRPPLNGNQWEIVPPGDEYYPGNGHVDPIGPPPPWIPPPPPPPLPPPYVPPRPGDGGGNGVVTLPTPSLGVGIGTLAVIALVAYFAFQRRGT